MYIYIYIYMYNEGAPDRGPLKVSMELRRDAVVFRAGPRKPCWQKKCRLMYIYIYIYTHNLSLSIYIYIYVYIYIYMYTYIHTYMYKKAK